MSNFYNILIDVFCSSSFVLVSFNNPRSLNATREIGLRTTHCPRSEGRENLVRSNPKIELDTIFTVGTDTIELGRDSNRPHSVYGCASPHEKVMINQMSLCS